MRLFLTAVLTLCVSMIFAENTLPKDLKINPNGTFGFAGFQFAPISIYGNWQQGKNNPGTLQKNSGNCVEVHNPVLFGTEETVLVSRFEPLDSRMFRYQVQAKFPDGVAGKLQYLEMTLPLDAPLTLTVQRKERQETLRFPDKFAKTTLLNFGGAETASLALRNGVELLFSGRCTVFVQDNRKYNHKTFCIRFWFSQGNLTLNMTLRKPQITPVELGSAANRSFSDEVAEDRLGGWTDQGASNDLRMLPPGKMMFKNLVFNIIDEKKSASPGAIIVAGEKRGFAPAEVELNLPPNEARTIALLHASAWTPRMQLGELEVTYPDTGVQVIPIRGGIEVGNWWTSGDLPNAKIAWRASSSDSPIGLYVSCFSLNGRGPSRLKFRITHPAAVWMVAAVSLSDGRVELPSHVARPLEMKANQKWIPMDFKRRTVPGSPLDFSSIAIDHVPAGKFGPVITAPDGSLVFEKAPDRRFRAYGVNLCDGAQYLEPADAERLAEFLFRQGINSVRFHHHDNHLIARDSRDSTTLDPKQLDKLEYLVAKLKERGIYLTFDLYTSRKVRPGDKLPILEKYPELSFKAAILCSPEGRDNWKRFTRNWMTHRNPHTGLTWAEDPAILFVNLVNEDTLTYNINPNPDTARCYADLFREYCRKNNLPLSKPSLGDPVFGKFMYELQSAAHREFTRFLREEIGARWAVTSSNFNGNVGTTLLRDNFDAVDDHGYHDHPSFPERSWSLPHVYSQTSTIAAEAPLPMGLARGRIYGKPMYVTEFNFCAPNRFRAEDGPLTGAYSALQNFAGVYRFNFSGSLRRFLSLEPGIIVFESVNDPVMQLSDRISAAFFVRGDVQTAEKKYKYTIDRNFYDKKRDSGYPAIRPVGLFAQIGADFSDRKAAGTVDYASAEDPELMRFMDTFHKTRVAVSSTGQIRLDAAKNTFAVTTPRSESVTLPGGELKAGRLAVSGADVFQTIAAISRDGKSLGESDSVVILHLTDVLSSGMRFADQDRVRLEKTGHAPLLLRRGRADVSLKLEKPRKVFALNMQGETLGEVKSGYRNGTLTFCADNGAFPGGVVGYWIR